MAFLWCWYQVYRSILVILAYHLSAHLLHFVPWEMNNAYVHFRFMVMKMSSSLSSLFCFFPLHPDVQSNLFLIFRFFTKISFHRTVCSIANRFLVISYNPRNQGFTVQHRTFKIRGWWWCWETWPVARRDFGQVLYLSLGRRWKLSTRMSKSPKIASFECSFRKPVIYDMNYWTNFCSLLNWSLRRIAWHPAYGNVWRLRLCLMQPDIVRQAYNRKQALL